LSKPIETLRQYLLQEFKSHGVPLQVRHLNPITLQGIYDGYGPYYQWFSLVIMLTYVMAQNNRVSRKIHNMVLMVPPEEYELRLYIDAVKFVSIEP
jgi:hypothetical protein